MPGTTVQWEQRYNGPTITLWAGAFGTEGRALLEALRQEGVGPLEELEKGQRG